MTGFLRRLGSLRLALHLLLALCVLAAVGSAVPQGLDPEEYHRLFPRSSGLLLALGLDRYYSGILFRSALALLAANLAACGLRRSVDGVAGVLGRGSPSLTLPLGNREQRQAALERLGFRVRSTSPLYAVRRGWAFLGFPLVHLAPLVILGGGLGGSLAGYVGTQNVYVGMEVETVHDWSAGAPRKLPYRLWVDGFRLLHYPAHVRFRAIEPGGREQVLEGDEGRRTDVPGTALAVEIAAFDPTSGDLVYFVEGPFGRAGPFSRGREDGAPLLVRPDAYRDLHVRRAEASLSIRDDSGQVLDSVVVAINEPLVRDGLRVFLTNWGEDAYKNRYIGLQVTRDPGQPFVWAGSVALALGTLVLLFGQGAWAREEDGVLLVKGLSSRAAEALCAQSGDT